MNDERKKQLQTFLTSLQLNPEAIDLKLLHLSLIHRSWNVEHGETGDNERLEFLGDAVIGLSTTVYLYEILPDTSEGDLSKLRATMVSRKVLGEIALGMNLGKYLNLGVGEKTNGGHLRLSTLGSALEAVCGALYLSHNFSDDDLKTFLRRVIIEPAYAMAQRRIMKDYKSLLQEHTQSELQALPQYRVLEEDGPDHQKKFIVGVYINGEKLGEGKGSRKKSAENEAARLALDHLMETVQKS